MKTLIVLLATTVFVCGIQVAQSDQAILRPTTASNSYNGNDRGLMGACCLPDSSCVMEYAAQCYSSWGGAYMGGDCADNPCDAFTGACCLEDDTCEQLFVADCGDYGGWYMGDVDCSDVSCDLGWDIAACCYGERECEILDYFECDKLGGTMHFKLSCEQVSCPIPCPPSPSGIFSSIAYPLNIECEDQDWYWPGSNNGNTIDTRIDLDGDGAEEKIVAYARFMTQSDEDIDVHGSFIKIGSTSGSIKITELIDLNPTSLTYAGVQFCDEIHCNLAGLLDVTGDGLPDAIVQVISDMCYIGYHYVENISIPPAAACASDLNNDGAVEVNDLMQIISNWGACE
jgi:hypothetical protein